MWQYHEEAAAERDAPCLAEGMGLKNSLADLPFGRRQGSHCGAERAPRPPSIVRRDGRRESSLPAQQRYGKEARQDQGTVPQGGAKANSTDATG
ncbi:hypothetical protein [Acidovorax sp. SUPP2539]|uniref:hypothetical protein n=1 Tax=Acidovorax sp. SUPP2539 TaxID=2920878 RepID=UPI0024E1761F|nr:hypothetical protein [Acidovorax sp. SUPP2539]